MIDITGSCNPEKLRKVLMASRVVLRSFTGLTKEDKEEILVDVCYRFEVDKAKFPISVYMKHCRNKVIGFLGKKTAKKRMLQKVVDGKVVYYETLSLNAKVSDDDEDKEFGELVSAKDNSFLEVELLADIESKAPEYVPLVKAVLSGEKLTAPQKKALKKLMERQA